MLFRRKILVQRHLARDGSHPIERGAHTQVHRKVWTPRHTCWGSRTSRLNPPIDGCHTNDRSIQPRFGPWRVVGLPPGRFVSGGGSETATVRMPSFETAREPRHADGCVGLIHASGSSTANNSA